jgi:hypothetical protein
MMDAVAPQKDRKDIDMWPIISIGFAAIHACLAVYASGISNDFGMYWSLVWCLIFFRWSFEK